jgi:hypothetical protein
MFTLNSTALLNLNALRARRISNLRWKDEDIQLIVQWLCVRDENDISINLNVYQKNNKMKTCRRMLTKTELNILKSEISKKKARDKMMTMIKIYRNVRNITKEIEWEVDFTKHDVVVDNSKKMTIKEMLIKKCFFYYEFDSLMSDLSIVISSFVMKSIRFDSSQLADILSIANESDTKIYSQTKNSNNEKADADNDYENVEDVQSDVIKSRTNLNKRVQRLIKKKISISKAFKRHLIIDSDSEESIFKITKREFKNKSITDVLIEVQIMKFKDFIARFEYEIRQRNQHHKKLVLKQKEMISSSKMQHEERMMRLQIELEKTSQRNL